MANRKSTFSKIGYCCPYCGYEVTCDDWGHDLDGEACICDQCGKWYRATAQIDVTYIATPDCAINYEAHQLKPFNGEFSLCTECGTLVSKKKKRGKLHGITNSHERL